MTAEPKTHDIAALTQQLQGATSSYAEAARRARTASREETEALNKLNQCQKDFDTAVEAIRSKAARESDWARKTGRKFEVSA